ncbi:MAG: alpha/beta fold hydrolase, partial [Cyanobacteria bacterium P01_H01_bin.105]
MTAIATTLNGSVATYDWQWQGQTIHVTYETLGNGESVLLLPAFSTVSSRTELTILARNLASQYRVTVLDWPGFGDSDRLRLTYGPHLYQQFLKEFVEAQFSEPVAVVAAGHAAGYSLAIPEAWSKIALVAPTWRGPLAVMGASETVRSGVRELVRSHLLGQFLYWLNTRPAFLKWMYRRHVFVNEDNLTSGYIAQRHQGTQKSGARYAPAAFVTG